MVIKNDAEYDLAARRLDALVDIGESELTENQEREMDALAEAERYPLR